MFFNVPESGTKDSMLSLDDIGAGPVDIVDIVRLGARSSEKSCPLRVQFTNLMVIKGLSFKEKQN